MINDARERLCWVGSANSMDVLSVTSETSAVGITRRRLEPNDLRRVRDMQQRLDAADDPAVSGYRFVTMAELDDLDVRAEAHRVAWEGSTRSAEDVQSTMEQWPYRPDLDVVVLTEDGAPAGSAIIWFDDSYDYGEFEPVGTGSTHRGKGLGASLIRFGLARLGRAGAAWAVVGARGDDDFPVPRHLYASVGFEAFTTQQVVQRP